MNFTKADSPTIIAKNLTMGKIKINFVTSLLLSISFGLGLLSCQQEIKTYDRYEDHELEIVRKHKIAQKTTIKVGLDTLGRPKWNRTHLIELYNRNGNRSMNISPKYRSVSSSGGASLNEISNLEYLFETNIPTGDADTTVFKYDNNNNLMLLKERSFVTSFKYDKYNNCIERCYSSPYTETNCKLSMYKYNQAGQIASRIDSFGISSNPLGVRVPAQKIEMKYEYDNSGRIIFDGEFRRIFNSSNLVHDKKINS